MTFLALVLVSVSCVTARADDVFIRANQVGYSPTDAKVAIAFSTGDLPADFALVSATDGKVIYHGRAAPVADVEWGRFKHHAELDFSAIRAPGTYVLRFGDAKSLPLQIAAAPYDALPADLLDFMHEQRCGHNPWLDVDCHTHDGRTAYGPLPAGTQIDVSGGWHDAGDLLKYLMTSEEATAQMLLACALVPKSRQNAEVLDESRWGLEWMLKMHPAPDQLYHQVGDDRDHAGWRLPQNDPVDYGWGKGGPRVAYCADGRPQGLQVYKSASNGVANLAGVYSAAMGLAYQIYKDDPQQKSFAARCLQAGKEVYELGRQKEGVQQGNSYKAPYRYAPTTWAGDMEWGAAELFRATGEARYLDEAKRYAKLAGDEGWMGKEQTDHYQFFPFINLGHYRLYELADADVQKFLAESYRKQIERCVAAGERNPYRIGVPFIWCSNNLDVALVTQCALYERMTGDRRFAPFAAKQRDWLLGRNPWGTTMFTGVGAVSPKDVHLMTVQLLHRPVRGGLVDGPVYDRIFKSLKGVSIREPDPLAAFQGPAVYHDDVHDYSSNEPTLDGTASAILMFELCRPVGHDH